MLETNKVLENQKTNKKKRSWKGFFSLGLLVIGILLLTWMSFVEVSASWASQAGFILLFFIISIFASIGLILFLIAKEFNAREKIITIFLLLPFILRIIFLWIPSPVGLIVLPQAERIEQKAIETRDVEKCYRIGVLSPPKFLWDFIFPRPVDRSLAQLQRECVSGVAVAEKDELICDSLVGKTAYSPYEGSLKNECYIIVAEEKEDLTICEKLENSECYQRVFLVSEKYNEILEECRKFPIPRHSENRRYIDEVNECIKNIAIKTNNPELCKGITWGGTAKECQREIKIAVDDILAPCQDLLISKKKKECIKNIAIEKGDIDLCGIISNEYWDYYVKECYKGIIFNGMRSDLDLCIEEFPDSKRLPQKVCFAAVGVNKNDLSICKKYELYSATEWCYTGIALKRKDPNICRERDCFTELAVALDDLEICNEIKEYEYYRETCIVEVAVQRDDEKLCETLSRSDTKSNCYSLLK